MAPAHRRRLARLRRGQRGPATQSPNRPAKRSGRHRSVLGNDQGWTGIPGPWSQLSGSRPPTTLVRFFRPQIWSKLGVFFFHQPPTHPVPNELPLPCSDRIARGTVPAWDLFVQRTPLVRNLFVQQTALVRTATFATEVSRCPGSVSRTYFPCRLSWRAGRRGTRRKLF